MSFTLFKIGGSRKNTLNNIATLPYFLKNTAYHYTSLPRNYSIIDSLPILARYGNTLNAYCQRRKETLNSIVGITSND